MNIKYIKLINNERLNPRICSSKACTNDDSEQTCMQEDYAECSAYSNDMCSTKDYAGCTNSSNDICTNDYAACYIEGSWDYCYTDLTAGED